MGAAGIWFDCREAPGVQPLPVSSYLWPEYVSSLTRFLLPGHSEVVKIPSPHHRSCIRSQK